MMTRGEKLNDYEGFAEKFKPKRTTDDCITPEPVYEAIRDWCIHEYGLDSARIIRPFWPGADYQSADYSGDCVVIDNPPFSILAQITDWYQKNNIKYFLFAPTLTLFSNRRSNYWVVVGYGITYENGAKVSTSFVTNLGDSKIFVSPKLYELVAAADIRNRREGKASAELPKYIYPDNVATSTRLGRLAQYGVKLKIPPEDAYFIRSLDSQKQNKKAIFGGGVLLSWRAAAEKAAAEKAAAEKAAAEKAAAEKAAAIRWELSERELKIIDSLGESNH